MTDYCEWSDLPKHECQHCRDGLKVTGNATKKQMQFGDGDDYEPRAGGTSQPFPARFFGRCGECRNAINEDDMIVMRDGRAIHDHCA